MVKVNIEIEEKVAEYYNLTPDENIQLMKNIKPMKDSLENQMRVYLEHCLQDLKELKNECKKK